MAREFVLDALELALVRFHLLYALDESFDTVVQDRTPGALIRGYLRFLAGLLALRTAAFCHAYRRWVLLPRIVAVPEWLST